jgi:hypothetical protein
MIKVVSKVERNGLLYGANLPMHYADMVHFFGEPTKSIGNNRRVEWYLTEVRDGEDDIRAIIYDSMESDNIEGESMFHVECHCDRSFEIVAEYINQEKLNGKGFLTSSINGEDTKQERYEVKYDNKEEK